MPTGKVIVILSPKGGSGKTMVATNLGVALAGTNSGDVALVDLDCVFGDVASVLGMVPDRTVGQLATLPSFDSTTLKVFLTRHEQSGLLVLAGSGLPEEGEAVTSQLSGQVIDILARDFAYVVVDTAAGLDERGPGRDRARHRRHLPGQHGRRQHPQPHQRGERPRPAAHDRRIAALRAQPCRHQGAGSRLPRWKLPSA